MNTTTFKTPEEVETSITCETDEFSSLTTCKMPNKNTCSDDGSDSEMNCVGNRTYSSLRVDYDKENSAIFSINGYVFDLGWTFLESALDKDGKTILFSKTDSTVPYCNQSACQHKEYFSISLDKNYLIKHKDSGISIKIYGKRGTARIELPNIYIKGFLNYIRNNNVK